MRRALSRTVLLAMLLAGCVDEAQRNRAAAADAEGEKRASPVTVLLRSDTATSPGGAVVRPKFPPDEYLEKRLRMVEDQIRSRGVRDRATLKAMERVPRHRMIPAGRADSAYEDHPLRIGHGQTISQPYIVGLMTEMLELKPGDRVLEVGTGSGYQAAILAEIVREVTTIEIIDALARPAAARLKAFGYRNMTVLSGDGYFGWEALAPYDAIIVTAAAEHVPPPLVAQLKPGGRMAIPVGRSGWTQNLLLVQKKEDGSVTSKNVLPVRFVPLTRRPR